MGKKTKSLSIDDLARRGMDRSWFRKKTRIDPSINLSDPDLKLTDEQILLLTEEERCEYCKHEYCCTCVGGGLSEDQGPGSYCDNLDFFEDR